MYSPVFWQSVFWKSVFFEIVIFGKHYFGNCTLDNWYSAIGQIAISTYFGNEYKLATTV